MTEMLANWLWQGAVVALVSEALVRAVPRISPAARYIVWLGALTMVLLLPVFALFPPSGPESPAPLVPPTYSIRLAEIAAPTGAIITSLWALWFALGIGRVGAALSALHRAKRRASALSDSRSARLPGWSAVRDQGRSARLAVSRQVDNAAVFGLTRPLIAVAPDLLQHLDDRDLDRVVLHEWAHVQRRDDIVLLLQGVVLAVAGFHPAVWWLHRRLNLERELACDEIAARMSGSAKAYAACLATMADVSVSTSRPLLLPAIFMSTQLRVRIEQLLTTSPSSPRRSKFALALALPGLLLLTATLVFSPIFTSHSMLVSPREFPAMDRALPALAVSSANSGVVGSIAAPSLGSDSSSVRRTGAVPNGRSGRSSSAAKSPVAEGPALASSAMPVLASRPELGSDDVEMSRTPERHAVPSATLASQEPALPAFSRATDYPPLMPVAPGETSGVERSPTGPRWGSATAAAVRVGSDSERAARATAGVFSRFGKRVARSFSSQ